MAKFCDGFGLDLADAFAGDVEELTELLECAWLASIEAEFEAR